MSSFEGFINELGPVTKFLTAASVLSTASFVFGIVEPSYLLVDVPSTFMKLQLWRPITSATFLGKFGFPWLVNVAMLVMYLKNHEDFYAGRRADLVWMMLFVIGILNAVAVAMGLQVVSFSFIMALVWIFCKRNEGQNFKIYSFAFRATIFPWALTAFHLVLGQDISNDLIGIVAGHVYFFLHDMQPLTNGGKNYIATPQWMYSIFPNQVMGARGVYRAAEARPAAGGAAGGAPAHRAWQGTGRRLGSD